MFPTCTTKEFKDDISKLCKNCPLTEKIKKGIKEQIIFQAEQNKSILSDEQFKNYINVEIEEAIKIMKEISILSQNDNEYTPNRIYLYIWNKERIKALNSFITGQKKNSKNEFLQFSEIFKTPYSNVEKINELKRLLKNNGFIDNDNNWIGITKRKNELAYLYWFFKENNTIIKQGSFSEQIRVFYKEFGLIVYDEKDDIKGYTTKKNLVKHNINNETFDNYQTIFSLWI